MTVSWKVSVIGMGVVGQATFEVLQRLGHQVEGSDLYQEQYPQRPSRSYLYFICVPEQSVEEPVSFIAKEFPSEEEIIVVRSTVPPGTCRKLEKKYQRHIFSMPEHLRAATALWDSWFPHYILLGQCCWSHGDMIERIYKPLGVPIIRTDPTTAELAKYAANNWFSTVISYWNSIYLLANKIGVNPHVVGKIVTGDPRISSYGTLMGIGLTGACLPKDLEAMIAFCQKVGANPTLFEAVKTVDELLKGDI